MDIQNLGEIIFKLEYQMWEVAKNKDVAGFKTLVADDAVMVCGGYRCLGVEYAEYIKEFDLSDYEINYEEVIYLSDEAVQIHYVIDIKTESDLSDLGGIFQVVSLWKKVNNQWKLCFNMDSRIVL